MQESDAGLGVACGTSGASDGLCTLFRAAAALDDAAALAALLDRSANCVLPTWDASVARGVVYGAWSVAARELLRVCGATADEGGVVTLHSVAYRARRAHFGALMQHPVRVEKLREAGVPTLWSPAWEDEYARLAISLALFDAAADATILEGALSRLRRLLALGSSAEVAHGWASTQSGAEHLNELVAVSVSCAVCILRAAVTDRRQPAPPSQTQEPCFCELGCEGDSWVSLPSCPVNHTPPALQRTAAGVDTIVSLGQLLCARTRAPCGSVGDVVAVNYMNEILAVFGMLPVYAGGAAEWLLWRSAPLFAAVVQKVPRSRDIAESVMMNLLEAFATSAGLTTDVSALRHVAPALQLALTSFGDHAARDVITIWNKTFAVAPMALPVPDGLRAGLERRAGEVCCCVCLCVLASARALVLSCAWVAPQKVCERSCVSNCAWCGPLRRRATRGRRAEPLGRAVRNAGLR